MKIGDNSYIANLTAQDGAAVVTIPERLANDSVREIMDAETLTADDGTVYQLAELSAIKLSGIMTEFRWKLSSEAESLRAQLQTKQAELDAKSERLRRIFEALENVGNGLPTLTKLAEFLSAVREALNDE